MLVVMNCYPSQAMNAIDPKVSNGVLAIMNCASLEPNLYAFINKIIIVLAIGLHITTNKT